MPTVQLHYNQTLFLICRIDTTSSQCSCRCLHNPRQEVADIEQTLKLELSKTGTKNAAASRSFTLVQGEANNSEHSLGS